MIIHFGPYAPNRHKFDVVFQKRRMGTSDVFIYYTLCASAQLGTVGSTSDVLRFYVFVSVTNTGILSWNDMNFTHK